MMAGAPGARFPAGATLRFVSNGQARPLVPGFAASADASIGSTAGAFSSRENEAGRSVADLGSSSGRRRAAARHGIQGRCGRAVLSRRRADRVRPAHVIGISARKHAARRRRSNSPDVRAGQPSGHGCAARRPRSLRCPTPRCRLAPARCVRGLRGRQGRRDLPLRARSRPSSGRQLASGDIVFETAGRLARFTSARADQVEIPLPAGQFAGPVAEVSSGDWLVAYRPDSQAPYGIYRWKRARANRKSWWRRRAPTPSSPCSCVPTRFPTSIRPGWGIERAPTCCA